MTRSLEVRVSCLREGSGASTRRRSAAPEGAFRISYLYSAFIRRISHVIFLDLRRASNSSRPPKSSIASPDHRFTLKSDSGARVSGSTSPMVTSAAPVTTKKIPEGSLRSNISVYPGSLSKRQIQDNQSHRNRNGERYRALVPVLRAVFGQAGRAVHQSIQALRCAGPGHQAH